MARIFTLACLACFSVFGASAAWAEIRLLPTTFTLQGQEGRQQLAAFELRESTVPTADGDSRALQLGALVTAELEFVSSNTEVVRLVDGVAVAVGNGEATITVTSASGEESSSRVQVVGCEQEPSWSFRHDVQSVLSRVGCNMGACHGALAGKGGFRLSLRGYDAMADYYTMTREAQGRRIEIADPGLSLVLAKPTGAVPHKGGLKLRTDSRDYRILAEWISHGAVGPSETDAKLERISVLPEDALLTQGDQTRVLVSAHYDDGRVVDVTHWARFTAADESVATVDEDGHVTVRGNGVSAISVWFGSKIALARLTVPYPNSTAAEVFTSAPRKNFIDELNLEQLQGLNLPPSPRCDDDTYLRRATVDTIGRLPTLEEREQYYAEDASQRRDALVERLLSSSDFADYWSYRWSDVLVINGTRLRPAAVKAYYEWIHQSVSENKPWDQMVREVVTAKGISTENGATNFYALNQSPEDMTENACQAFLGLSIGCAKCHNHPLEKWTNDQYYAMANMFARVRAKGWGGDGRNGDGLRTLYVAPTGDLLQPKTGRPQPPAPLDAEALDFDDPSDRREVLADWMTSSDNPYFARAIANRVWANFFGRGLVEQVDDLRLSNPATNEALLAATAEHVVDAGFDLKQLMRSILQSETYQRSSVALEGNRYEDRYHSRYYPKRMMAEVLLDSIDQALGTTTSFTQIAFPGADKQKTDFYPEGTRALQLYDASVDSYFLNTFGRNPREITCECERSSEPNMVQVLHMANGDTLNQKLEADGNVLSQWLSEGLTSEEILQKFFTRALGRMPSVGELQKLLRVVEEYDDRRTALQDAAWGILTSPEFTFNH